MTTERFLGGAWASIHGPGDPKALLRWVLEHGFRGLMVGPAPRPVLWERLRSVLGELPVSLAGVRVGGILELAGTAAGNLASTHTGERATAVRRVLEAVELAKRLGCPRVVLEPGIVRATGDHGPEDLGDPAAGWTEELASIERARRDAALNPALDAACRSIYEVVRAAPGLEFCLTGSRHVRGLGEPVALAHIFDDLASLGLSYWHDVPLAARCQELLGTSQGQWLEEFCNRMTGMTLGDSLEGELYLPPGAGGVDYPLVAAYRRRSGRPIPAVVELDPAVEPSEIPGVHAFLSKYGL